MDVIQAVKYVHAASGFIVLISGLLQILLKKSGKIHRIIGNIYFWAWCFLIPSGAIIGSIIITLFGVFGFYMALSGYRFGIRKDIYLNTFDKSIIYLGLLCSSVTLMFCIYLVIMKKFDFAFVTAFLGGIFFINTLNDYRKLIQKSKNFLIKNEKMIWYFEHFTRMYISYIAAITAFSVIQNLFRNGILNWILPTIIGTFLIFMSVKFYRKKFNV